MAISLSRPIHINFEIVSECNYHCVFCAAQWEKYRLTYLPTVQIKKIIDKLVNAEIYSIFFTGGEPFIRKDLIEILKYAVDNGMNVTVSTNGSLITREVAERLNKIGVDEVQVSLHGLEKTHERITKVPNSYYLTLRGIEYLHEAGIGVIVASVGMKTNYRELPQLAREVADMGAIAYRVLRLMPNKPELLDQVLEEEESRWLIEELDKVRHEKKIEVEVHVPPGCFHTRYFNPLLFPKFSHAYTSICTACKASMAILSNGDVVPCIELKEIKLGNILHQDIEEIWNTEKCKEMRNLTPSTYTGLCRICPLRHVCYSARCLAYRFNGSLYADDPTCVLIKQSQNNKEIFDKLSRIKLRELKDYADQHILANTENI
jgi:radical SAM protein with 4Fe4S-binding SPASM domain